MDLMEFKESGAISQDCHLTPNPIHNNVAEACVVDMKVLLIS